MVSRASVIVSRGVPPEAAAKMGFTTFRRSGKNVWERVAGPDSGLEPVPEPPAEGVFRVGKDDEEP